MCIDYRKLNKATKKDHFPLPFIDEMLERLANHSFYCFLDGYSGYHQILIHPDDQSKTTFTCPYGTYAYRRMSFGLCNAPASFQRCMMSIFSEMIEKIMEVFMDDFIVYGKTFTDCLKNLDMSNNHLSGTIRRSMGFLTYLKNFILSNNHFFGEFPSFMKNCSTSLSSLDISDDNFLGNFQSG